MRRRWTTAIAASCGLLASCSLVTSWDGLTGADAGTHDAGGGGAGGAGTTGAGGHGGSTIDASPDVAPDVVDPNACTPKHHYCGGHVVEGSPSKLYICIGDGTASEIEACTHGCLVLPATKDDHCRCLVGGSYCGGDHIDGDPGTLYQCNMDGSGKLIQKCLKKCVVTPGKDDSCEQ